MKIEEVKKWIEKYEKTGRIAHLYPRKKRISLNGARSLPIHEAVVKMKKAIDCEQSL